MKPGFRIGVGLRLLTGLATLALFTIIVAVVAVTSFKGLENNALEATGGQLDLVIAANELARLGESAAAIGPALVVPANRTQWETATVRSRDQIDLLRDALNSLEKQGLDGERLGRLGPLVEELAANLLALGEAVERRIGNSLAEQGLRAEIIDLARDLRGGGAADAAPARQLALATLSLTDQLFLAKTPADLAKSAEALREAGLKSEASGVGDFIGRRVSELAARALSVRRQLLASEASVVAVLNANDGAANRMVTEVATLVDQLRQEAQTKAQALAKDTVDRANLIMLVTGFCVFGAIVLIIYVRGSVIERIGTLRAAMVTRMEGGKSAIPVESQDEIGDMARVLNYFVTSLEDREQDLKASERKFREIAQTVPGMVFQWRQPAEGRGGYSYVSPRVQEIFGVSADQLLNDPIAFPCHPDEMVRFGLMRSQAGERGEGWTFEGRFTRPDGSLGWWQEITKAFRVSDTEILFAGVALDVSDRRAAEENLRMAHKVFETATEGIIVCNGDNSITAVNPAFTRITGFEESEVIGRNPRILSSGHHDSTFYREIWDALSARGRWEGEIWNRRKNGEVFPEWLSISAIRDDFGGIVEYVGVFSDITKRKRAEEQIRFQANYDALTKLPNRALFQDRLEGAIKRAERESETFALMFVDLDRFKVVNDTLGHAAGDKLLEKAAQRIADCVRQMDTVARFGGDEFTVILQDMTRGRDAAIVADNIIRGLSDSFDVGNNQQAFIGGSIGIAIYPNDGGDAVTLLRNADMAMYRSKEAGRNQYRFFTSEMDVEALERMSLEHDLRRAVEEDQFFVVYQPIIDLKTGKLAGAEALLRWNHPVRDVVGPDQFVPVAEDSGLIGVLGEWVLRSVCAQMKVWRAAAVPIPKVSVNLSSRQLKKGLSLDRIREVLNSAGLVPADLTFEITESGVFSDSDGAINWLGAVRDFGIGLSIDDFGTGYSSLSYLTRLPVDTVKIDRHFVAQMLDHADEAQLVEAIIQLAHSLDFRVVAEGVETEEQIAFLRDRGCDYLQGFHFSRPLEAEPFERYVADFCGPKPGRITMTTRKAHTA
ncbi:MAG: EAL domain-containing protein [Rhodospirillales bacterium]